jgi:stress response protein SCP2
MIRLLTILTLLFPLFGNIVNAQINETFSDLDFTNNPEWTGDIDKFEVVNPPNTGDGSIDIAWTPDAHMLRSIPDSGSAVLSTISNRSTGEWLFSIADGRGWSVSGSNDFYVVIMSDTNDPSLLIDDTKNFNGYFLRLDGSNSDNFTFNKQVGTTTTMLIDAAFPEGNDGTTSKAYSVKITRDNDGNWELFIDEGLYMDAVTSKGTVLDNEITTSSYFGFATNISNPGSTRTAYIDNIITRDPYTDTFAPFITEIQINGNNHLRLKFDELVDSLTAHTATNYNIQGIGVASEANYYFENYTEMQLSFNEAFIAGSAYAITINGVEDLNGNVMDTTIQITVPNLLGQNITESFTDFDLTNNLTWTGNLSDFEIINPSISGNGSFSDVYQNDGALLRNKVNTTSSCITTELIRNYGQWSFTVGDGNGWSISGTNDYYIIITASTNDPALLKPDNPNFYGYYLRYDGSADDSFVLYKQTGAVATPIIETGYPAGTDGTTPIPYTIKITRDTLSGWSLYIDEGTYTDPITLRGTSADNEIQTGNYFGLVTNISTPSDSRVVYLDSIYAGEIIVDEQAPFVENAKIIGDKSIKISFDEFIETTGAVQLTNYSIEGIGNPVQANFYYENEKEIELTFDTDFNAENTLSLSIQNITDANGNTTDTTVTILVPTVLGQNIHESFTDFDLTNNLLWTGELNDFEIINPETEGNGSFSETYENDGAMLRSKANTESSCITTELIRNYGQWSFTIAEGTGWSISGSNDYYVIITANTNDTAALKSNNPNFYGYYLRRDGGANDKFVLYKQQGTTATPIIETNYPEENDGSTSIPYSVKITRDTLEGWSLYIDEGTYNDPVTLRGTSADNDIETGNYFGLVTNISTLSDSRVVYLDSIYAGEIIVDEQAPFVENAKIIGDKSIKISFDEFIETTGAIQLTNYSIEGIGNPVQANFYYENEKEIELTFDTDFNAENTLSLSIQNISDANGNTTDTTVTILVPTVLGQNIHESFTDFDLTNNLLWTGELNDFEIINPETEGNGSFSETYENDGTLLRSKVNTESSCLTTELIRNYGQWSFTIAEGTGWSISGSNDYYVIITANTNDTIALKSDNPNFYGYYLRRDGGANDKFVLYKQQGTTSTPIIETNYPEGTDGSTSVPYSVKIVRDTLEGWSLYIDEGSYKEAYTLRGTSLDNEIQTGNYFGIVTNINTISETRVLYLDSIYAGAIIKDTISPVVERISVISENEIKVQFSETVDTTILSTSNFTTVNNGNPSSIEIQDAGSTFQLVFDANFPLREMENLTITGIIDIEGNEMTDTTLQFVYFEPIEGDIVINEIFFDNSPVVGLPEYDYIELYNRSGFDINLQNWTIEIGDDTREFPEYILSNNEYLIVTSSAAEESYEAFGNTIDVITTTLLTNTGKQITLKDSTGTNIHYISYTQNWYRNSDKEDGGWSIEQIDPEWYCAQAGNWKASTNSLGGTPGTQNSVLAENPDTTAPFLKAIAVTETNQISLTFSETLQEGTFNSSNIAISPVNSIETLIVNESTPNNWIITLTDSLPERQTIGVTVSNLIDYCGNTNLSDTITTIMVPSYFQQMIFTEIMAIPAEDDRIQYEFLELYNHDSLPVNIESWTLKIGSRSLALPSATINAKSYFLIMPEFMSAHPSAPENAIFIFDDSDLTDGGTTLQLIDNKQNLVTWVDYDFRWHTNPLANLGGFSLERIDNTHYCGNSNNWETSSATIGGTPGAANSIASNNPDLTQPRANFLLVPEDTSLIVRFDQTLWPQVKAENINTSLTFDSIFIPHPYGQDLIIKLAEPLEENTLYDITVNQLTDCNMNVMEERTFAFKKPIEPGEGDFIINEILFNPPSGCNDFVEVLNLTDNYLDLSKVYSAKLDDNGIQDDIDEVVEENYILPPNEYYIFTASTECLEYAYGNVDVQKSIITSLPSMPDDEGSILFMNYSGEVIDQVEYTSDMHHSLLSDEDGVSLERISPFSPSDNTSNWYSAAADVGFATPNRENSQVNKSDISEENISLEKETLSPDGDGFEDYLRINYQFPAGGNVLSVKILDHNGRLVRNLLNNETVSTEGFITWDGTNDSQHKVPVGIYILYSEWFDENGNQQYDKRTCVVAGNLK